MNILLNNSHQDQGYIEIAKDKHADRSRFGERFATAVLIFYTTAALLVSAWSVVLINSGNLESGGPIGLFIQILKKSGIM